MFESEIEAYKTDQAELQEIPRQLEEIKKTLEQKRLKKVEREKKHQQDELIKKFAQKGERALHS